MTLRLVIFDVDGTLVDSQVQIVAAMDAAFDSEGLEPPGTAALSVVGLSLPLAIARLVPDAGPERVLRMAEVYKTAYARRRTADDAIGGAPLYPGARDAIERLRARDDVLLGVATGKSRRGLVHLFEAHGMNGCFQTLQCADDHPSKPHPAMVLAALAETGTDPAHAVIVGDTTYDMEMGHAAGIRAIGVAWGYHPAAQLQRSGAAHVLDDFGRLDAALAAMWEMANG